MITVEDLVIKLATSPTITIQTFDYRLVQSFTHQLWRGDGLTEKQGSLALKIIKKYHKVLTADTKINILQFLNNPVYKNPFRQPKNVKRISLSNYKDERIIGKSIKVEFPYNDNHISLIKENRSVLGVSFWSKEEKAWFFNLCEENIIFLTNLAEKENFECDEEFLQISQSYQEILQTIDQHVPTLMLEDGVPSYKNSVSYLPKIKSEEILPAIFEARRHGITVWSDDIGKYIEFLSNTVLSGFLTNEITEPYYIDSTKNHISCLTEIVQYLRPCIFVIPGGSELVKITEAYEFLCSLGISNEKMSVMFRLPSDKGKLFNEFIKNEKLNNNINENTEIVFISAKVPKPLIKSQIYFNSVINMGFDNAHYTSRNFVDNHQNLVYFSERPIQNRFLWSLIDSHI